ncbi:SAVED domain-containing protein [Amycolatopsis sp. CA-126428]|uniref:SAVED domain-containing protein n=1 Tax=Amycolatopsis sp. CA-126428 TaxID=2073158 RepID=UPI001304CEC6|nr:SAVED domain-containing protein [Amycolatopsis sp. CA-126428]
MRRSGDHYQDLIAWGAALRVIQPHNEITQLELEINGAGNVDDVVLRRPTLGHRYTQVKWATTTASMINDKYLTDRPRRGKSVLEKLYNSYQLLRNDDQPPTLELLSNRVLDPEDPLLSRVDGRTELLTPFARLALPDSAAGLQVAAWAEHVGSSRDDLINMLDHLTFRTGLTVASERDRAQVLMLAAGLRHDEDALETGIFAAAEWIRGGKRILTAHDIHDQIDELRLRAAKPRAILLIQAIDRDPHPEDATETLDWVDLYHGDSPMTRARPTDPANWAAMARDLNDAVNRLKSAGAQDILVRGALRQATFFLAGAQLAHVTGKTVSYVQQGALWSSNTPRKPVPPPAVTRVPVDAGTDLAVAIGIAVDPTAAVTQYLRDTAIPVGELVVFLPTDGAHDQAVGGPGEAVAYVQEIRNSIRLELERRPAERIHLYLAGPGGLALLLGHRWNRLAPTTVYEHLGPGRGYAPAFVVEA